jgi:hypothetical protein
VLKTLSSMASWWATRDDAYKAPFVRGMRRGSQTRRSRILDDDELRTVWTVAAGYGALGALIKLALLTAQRREKLLKDSTHGVPYQSCATLIDSSARWEQAAVAMLRMALSKISGDAASICSA